jgi:hypothetical protein
MCLYFTRNWIFFYPGSWPVRVIKEWNKLPDNIKSMVEDHKMTEQVSKHRRPTTSEQWRLCKDSTLGAIEPGRQVYPSTVPVSKGIPVGRTTAPGISGTIKLLTWLPARAPNLCWRLRTGGCCCCDQSSPPTSSTPRPQQQNVTMFCIYQSNSWSWHNGIYFQFVKR